MTEQSYDRAEMGPDPNAWISALGQSDVYVCYTDSSGQRVFTSAPLLKWLDEDAAVLDQTAPVVREGRSWQISRSDQPNGAKLHVVRPMGSGATMAVDQDRILQPLINASPVAILTLDLQMRVTMWNPACERIFGWPAAEVIGQHYPLVPEDEWDRFEGFFQTVIDGQGFNGVEAERHRSDGRRVHIAISTAPIRAASGEVIGAMAILEDITERKQLEAQYRQAMKLEAVGRLAGGIAHDFNNLLTVIMGYSDTLDGGGSPEDTREAANAIQHAAQRASKLTQQLLAFSRRQVLQVQVVDLNVVVQDTLDMIVRLIGSDIDVQTAFAHEPIFVKADPGQLEQVLMNLATNARDAMPLGGRLTLTTGHVDVDGEPWAQLAVSDTGVGIDAETAAHIFDPFFTTKEVGKGTGLGLASVYGIARQSGGDVTLESAIGEGATFRVRLPISAETDRPDEAEQQAVSRDRKATILVAEDNPDVRRILVRMLRSSGHTVVATEDGQAALDHVREDGLELDLLVTDVVMPGMTGGELAKHVQEVKPSVKVLFVSGYANDEVVRRGAAEGAPLLQKPFTLSSVTEAVSKLLESD